MKEMFLFFSLCLSIFPLSPSLSSEFGRKEWRERGRKGWVSAGLWIRFSLLSSPFLPLPNFGDCLKWETKWKSRKRKEEKRKGREKQREKEKRESRKREGRKSIQKFVCEFLSVFPLLALTFILLKTYTFLCSFIFSLSWFYFSFLSFSLLPFASQKFVVLTFNWTNLSFSNFFKTSSSFFEL